MTSFGERETWTHSAFEHDGLLKALLTDGTRVTALH